MDQTEPKKAKDKEAETPSKDDELSLQDLDQFVGGFREPTSPPRPQNMPERE